MKVLVLGASGYIGFSVALAYSRAGHIVYGTTRDAKWGRKLAFNEVIPLLTPATNGHGEAVWSKIAADCDIVIDTIRSMDPAAPLAALRAVEDIPGRGTPGTRVTYIFTGGVWSHSRGPGGLDAWSSEQAGVHANPERLAVTKWRDAVEQAVLSSDKVNGIVIRPGVLYGRSGNLLEPFLLGPAYEAGKSGRSFEAVGFPDTRLLMCHQDDLAELTVACGERGPQLKGTAVVAANPQSERWADILDAVVRVSGAGGYTLRPPNPKIDIEVAWASTTQVRPTLAHALTGWTPRKPGLVDGMDLYWSAFSTHVQNKKMVPAWDLPGVQPLPRLPSP